MNKGQKNIPVCIPDDRFPVICISAVLHVLWSNK